MTQSKTSLILNNLVELTLPTSSDSNRFLSFHENKGKSCPKLPRIIELLMIMSGYASDQSIISPISSFSQLDERFM